jgi:hypothetical protein
MENKKLVKILMKDMVELEELIAEVKLTRRFDDLEMEFIHTRAKGVLQLLQLLDSREVAALPEISENKEHVEKLIEKVEHATQVAAEMHAGKQQEFSREEEQKELQMPEYEEEINTVAEAREDNNGEIAEVEPVSDNTENEDTGMLEEERQKSQANSRLGDSFMKGKSVNDLITDKVKLEYKLSNRPVTSIQASIGINDRFRDIRELFDGDNKKFLEAVKTLDSMQNVKEAVDYLRNNYRWKKNETSLKFVNLVKRRFLN